MVNAMCKAVDCPVVEMACALTHCDLYHQISALNHSELFLGGGVGGGVVSASEGRNRHVDER